MFFTNFLSRHTQKVNQKSVKTLGEYESILPVFELSKEIDRNIFQICLRDQDSYATKVLKDLPDSFQENIRLIKDRNPEFNYQLISDKEATEFIKNKYGQTILSYYDRIDKRYPAARADLLRYLLLYASGGVYLDLKSTINKPLLETLRPEDQYLVFYWDNLSNGQHHCLIPDYIPKGEMLQAFIISAKGHPFMRKVILDVLKRIDQYNPYTEGTGWSGVIQTTGPAAYTINIYKTLLSTTPKEGHYREGLPFQEFGFQVHFQGNYSPGQYQKQLRLRDYRECSRPVIRSNSILLQITNICWLKLLAGYRKRILHQD